MQDHSETNDTLPSTVPTKSAVKKLDGKQNTADKTKATKPRQKLTTEGMSSPESILTSKSLSPIQMSFNSNLNMSIGSDGLPDANSLSERPNQEERQTLGKIDEHEENDSLDPYSKEKEQENLLSSEDMIKEYGDLFPMDHFFLEKLNDNKHTMKDLKGICRAYGLNPNTPTNVGAHSAISLISLATIFMQIRNNEVTIQQLGETEFEEMMRFGNIQPTLIMNKSKRGEAANVFKRWWLQSLNDIGRIEPADITTYPIPGIRALLGVAGYKVTESSASKQGAEDMLKRTQGMLAQQGFSMRESPNEFFSVSSPEIFHKASSHLIYLLHCAFGGDIDIFDLDNIEQIKLDISQSQAPTIDATVFTNENLTTLDAQDLRILNDMYGFDYAATQQISRESLQNMLPAVLDWAFPHKPSYIPKKTRPKSKISEHISTLALQRGSIPTKVKDPTENRDRGNSTSKEDEEDIEEDETYVETDYWNPIGNTTVSNQPSPQMTGKNWSKHRLISHLQMVDPHPEQYYERMCPITLRALIHSKPTATEYRLSNYNNIPKRISIDDLNRTQHMTLRHMLGQMWSLPTECLNYIKDTDLADEIWNSLEATTTAPLTISPPSLTTTTHTSTKHDPTTTAHLLQLEKVSSTVEKATETAAKSSRKADEGTRNLYDNLHDKSFHNLCCDDPPLSGASIPMSKLISTLYGGVYVQLSLRAYIDLANSLANVSFQDFVPLQQFMEQSTALRTVSPYATWRSEKPFPRKGIDFTNNDPELWRIIIRTLLNLTADILDLSPDIRTLCDIIATNVKHKLASFPHWSITTCTFVARKACEQFDLLRNHITNPSRPTLTWKVEGSTQGIGHIKYTTRLEVIMAGSKIPSWTTVEEIAQFNLHMHDSSVLQREGRASQYITPVTHNTNSLGSQNIVNMLTDKPISQPPPKDTVPKQVKVKVKGPHHCFHFLNSLGGGEPCKKGKDLCPYLHETSFRKAYEYDHVLNMAAKNNITLDLSKMGKRPFDMEYPEIQPRKRTKQQVVTFNTALNKKPVGARGKSRKRVAEYDPLLTILSEEKVIPAEDELDKGDCGFEAAVASEYFYTELFPTKFHTDQRIRHSLAFRLEMAYRMISEQVVSLDKTTNTRISTDPWETFLTYDDGAYTNEDGVRMIRPEDTGEIPRDLLAPRRNESTEARRRRIATRWITGEMSETDLTPIWLNADMYIDILRTHIASIAKTGQGRFVTKLVKQHGPAMFAIGPIGLAFIGENMNTWSHILSPTTENAFVQAYPIINTIDGDHFRVYVQRADKSTEFPYDSIPCDTWRKSWKTYPTANWRNMAPDRLLRLKEMTVEAGYTFFDPDNLPPFNLPIPRRRGPSALVMESEFVHMYDDDWDERDHPYTTGPNSSALQPFTTVLARSVGLLPTSFHSRVITAEQAVNSGEILYAGYVDFRTRKLMRALYSTEATWDPLLVQWKFQQIMANDDFFDLVITLDPNRLVCVFKRELIPTHVLEAFPLFSEDELTNEIREFQDNEARVPDIAQAPPARRDFAQPKPPRTRIAEYNNISTGQSTYPYAGGQVSIYTAPDRTFGPGQCILTNIKVDPLDISELFPHVMEMTVQIRIEGAPVYVFRDSLRQLQYIPVGVITDSVTFFPNCDLHWCDRLTTISVRCSRQCKNEEELFIEAGWYDHDPETLSVLARCRLFDRYWHEFVISKDPVLRRHIWLLADTTKRYQQRLRDSWKISELPTAHDLESVEAYILYEVLQDLLREQRNRQVGATSILYQVVTDETPSYDPILSDPPTQSCPISTTHSLCEDTTRLGGDERIVEDSMETIINEATTMNIDTPSTETPKSTRKTKGELKQRRREKEPGIHEGPEYAARVNAKKKEKQLKKGPRNQNISEQKRLLVLLTFVLTSLNTEAFVTKLAKLKVEFAAKEVDYTDDSNIVREMKSSDPPKLRVVTDDMFLQDEAALTAVGNDFHKLYELKIAKLKYRGLHRSSLMQWLQYRLPHRAESIIELMDNGMTAHMKPGWIPNGGASKNGKSVDNHLSVIEHAIATLSSKGRNILIREEFFPPNLKSNIHVHPIITAENPGKPNRVCFHMSHGTKAFPSYNSMVDMETHLQKYKRTALPTLHTLCDMFNTTRAMFPDVEYLHASVVDVSSAYHQYHLAYEKMLMVWTRLQILREGNYVTILNGMLVGTFGDIGAGDAWNNFAQALEELANTLSKMITSQIYVDDEVTVAPPLPSDVDPNRARPYFQATGGFVAEPELGCKTLAQGIEYAIQTAVIEQRNNIARFFGGLSTEEKKVWIYIGNCIALGWYFNLRYDGWYVLPKPEKVDKITHFLFNVVPETAKRIPHHTMQQLCGLLCWFSAAIPLGRAFVYTLFQCRRTHDNIVILNSAAQRDLTLWRAIMRIAWRHPALVGAPISSLGTPTTATKFIGTDGCTGIGGGAWLSNKPRWEASVSMFCFIIRWTRMEWEAINKAGIATPIPFSIDKEKYKPLLLNFCNQQTRFIPIHINVLEFAIVVIAIMLWAPLLRGRVVSIGTDNTACLCWIMKNKSASGIADALLKILALVCLLYDIRLVAHHVAGIINFLGDWLSRVTGIDICDARHFLAGAQRNPQDKFIQELQSMAEPASPYNRRDICRAILTRVLVHPDEMSRELLISIMTTLQQVPNVPTFPDNRVLQVLDGFVMAEDRGDDISAGISNTMHEAYTKFGSIAPARASPK